MPGTALTAILLAVAVCERCTAQMAPRMRRMVQTPRLVLPERSASSSHTLVRLRPNCNHKSHTMATALPLLQDCTGNCLFGSCLWVHSISKACCALYSRPANITANHPQNKYYSKPPQRAAPVAHTDKWRFPPHTLCSGSVDTDTYISTFSVISSCLVALSSAIVLGLKLYGRAVCCMVASYSMRHEDFQCHI